MMRWHYTIWLASALVLPGCKSTANLHSALDDDALNNGRALELESLLVGDLQKDNRKSQGKVWFVSKMQLQPDWFIESPAGYWGKPAAALPHNLGCNGSDPGCDPQFSLHLCQTDADCAPYQTTCQILYASVTKPGDEPRKMCLGSGDQLLNRFYNAMVATNAHLDITTLSNPTWRFWTMMVNALTYLSHKNPAPTVRILMSGRQSDKLNTEYPIQPVLDEITSQIKKLGGDLTNIRIDMGYLANGFDSWNHAKIVLVDDDRAIEGGHNMWDPDYLEDHPVFDASMEYYGQAAAETQAFVNELWTHVSPKTFANHPPLITVSFMGNPSPQKIVPPQLVPKTLSRVNVIGVGRLGAYGDNPSNTAFHSLIRNARDSLYLAQEDFFSRMFVCNADVIQDRLDLGHPDTLGDLVDAILRGVKVRIVQSDQIGEGASGYAMMSSHDSAAFIIEALAKEAQKRKIVPPTGQTMVQYVCSKFEIAPWRFTAGERVWGDGRRKIGSHPKMIIVDEAVFYLGSHNIYPGNLQEFGLITTDAGVTRQLVDSYWNKLWTAASPDKVACNRPDAELLPTRVSYQIFFEKVKEILQTQCKPPPPETAVPGAVVKPAP